MNQPICKSLIKLFESSKINYFTLDENSFNNTIKIKDELKNNKEHHTDLFEELQLITESLKESNCDFSIDINGDILLNCKIDGC